jgi:2-polyprenyl-3-methyl-5-hydroxy-6-metoxy-1,4-benzoquinol methylase
MALLSEYAQKKKLEYFFSKIDKKARILEVGCADGWVGAYAKENGWNNFVGLDILPNANADVIGDINEWKKLGLKKNSFDAIIAFEVIEHGDFARAFNDLLKPSGKLFVTTPVPHMDWLCKTLEKAGLNQTRSSLHSHLIYLEKVPHLELLEKQVKGFMSQWGIFTKGDEKTAVIAEA